MPLFFILSLPLTLSKNVSMGIRQSYKAGKVPFRYKNFLGYRKGADGSPEIDPEQAAVVRRIYHRYLSGQSVGQIRKDLEADGVLSPRGKGTWSEAVVQNILRNERYAGDALLQKTYVKDVLTHRAEKNNGELPQYYIQNNHPAIIDRDVWNKVQEEIARRVCKRKAPSKNARTGTSKYSGKYALGEILVCGECGTPYRRVTWTKPQGQVIVWRCVSRLEHGKKLCKNSPTMPEDALHAAILGAVSEAILRGALLDALTDSVRAAACAETGAAEYQAARLRIGELDGMARKAIEQSAEAGADEDFYDEKYRMIMDERAKWQKIVRDFEAKDSIDRYTERQVTEAVRLLEQEPLLLSKYDDQIVRQLVDTIRVLDKDRIMVTLKGGTEIEQRVEMRGQLHQKGEREMKIRKVITYILENEDGMTALAPATGDHVRLEFQGGTYHTGEVSEITEDGITISRNDGDYTYGAGEIMDIKMCGL